MSASDLQRAIAFAFRRKGADAMPGMDLRMLLAYDLRWFAPEDAKRVVQRALEVGLLAAEGETVRAAFDVKAVDIPVNFRPTTAVLDEPAPALPPHGAGAPPAAAPSAAPPPPRPAPPSEAERAAEDERKRRGLLVSVEVARLVVRRRAGEDVTVEAAALEARLIGAGAPARP